MPWGYLGPLAGLLSLGFEARIPAEFFLYTLLSVRTQIEIRIVVRKAMPASLSISNTLLALSGRARGRSSICICSCIRLSASGCDSDIVPFLQFPAQSAMILREFWPDYFGRDFFLSGFPQFPVVFTAKMRLVGLFPDACNGHVTC